MSQGPDAWAIDEAAFQKDLVGAVLAYSMLAREAMDGTFVEKFGDHVLAVAEITTEAPNVAVKVYGSGRTN